MKHYLLPLMSFGLLNTAFAADNVVMSSYYDGKRYDFAFSCSQLKQAPSWSNADANPPLALRRALVAGRAGLSKLVADADKWYINRISLRPACSQDWFYVVEFGPPRDGINSGFGIVVLMNGQTIEPRLSAWPVKP